MSIRLFFLPFFRAWKRRADLKSLLVRSCDSSVVSPIYPPNFSITAGPWQMRKCRVGVIDFHEKWSRRSVCKWLHWLLNSSTSILSLVEIWLRIFDAVEIISVGIFNIPAEISASLKKIFLQHFHHWNFRIQEWACQPYIFIIYHMENFIYITVMFNFFFISILISFFMSSRDLFEFRRASLSYPNFRKNSSKLILQWSGVRPNFKLFWRGSSLWSYDS